MLTLSSISCRRSRGFWHSYLFRFVYILGQNKVTDTLTMPRCYLPVVPQLFERKKKKPTTVVQFCPPLVYSLSVDNVGDTKYTDFFSASLKFQFFHSAFKRFLTLKN